MGVPGKMGLSNCAVTLKVKSFLCDEERLEEVLQASQSGALNEAVDEAVLHTSHDYLRTRLLAHMMILRNYV